MSAAFTPGPWAVEQRDTEHYCLVSANMLRPADAVDLNGGVYVAQVNGPDNQANARLIAAAPELYEALDQLRANAEVAKQNLVGTDAADIISSALFDTISQAEAALAKARGDQ